MVNWTDSTVAFQDTGTGTALTIPHTLESAAGRNRLLLVGVACKGNTGKCHPTVEASYGTSTTRINLTALGSVTQGTYGTSIYYALDADLPAPGSYTLRLLNNYEGYNALAAQIVEFTGVEQATFGSSPKYSAKSGGCGTLQAQFTALPTGSHAYVVAGSQTNGVYTNVVDPLDDLIGSQTQYELGFGTGHTRDPTTTGSIAVNDSFQPLDAGKYCNNMSMYTVALRPQVD
jgi:hypothetical protein